MFGLDEALNQAQAKIEEGFNKIKTLIYINIALSGALFIYSLWRRK